MCCWVVVARGAPPILMECNWAHKCLVHCTTSVWFGDNHTYLTFQVPCLMYYAITVSLCDLTLFSSCQMEKYLHFRDTSKRISCKLCRYFLLLTKYTISFSSGNIQIVAVRVVALCSVVGGYQRVWGGCSCYPWPWKWRHHVPLKCRYTSARCQNTEDRWSHTAMKMKI